MKSIATAACILLLASAAQTLEPKNPTALCDRFIAPLTRTACEKRLSKLSPDWYLASVCEKQFDDVIFFQCLELSSTINFSPVKLEKCNQPGGSDADRMACLSSIAEKGKARSEAYQDGSATSHRRKPASRTAKNKNQFTPTATPQPLGDPN